VCFAGDAQEKESLPKCGHENTSTVTDSDKPLFVWTCSWQKNSSDVNPASAPSSPSTPIRWRRQHRFLKKLFQLLPFQFTSNDDPQAGFTISNFNVIIHKTRYKSAPTLAPERKRAGKSAQQLVSKCLPTNVFSHIKLKLM
jgi:hypothetical protein